MRILVDGFNLSLEKGTGIATYARNLTHGLKALGHTVDVLYGYRLSDPEFALAREMEFYDPELRASNNVWFKRLGRLAFMATTWRTRRAAAVPQTGLVIDTGLKSRLPSFDRVLNANGLFDSATSAFHHFGLISTVSAAAPAPDIAHWTCPLPIKAAGCKNIYTVHDLVPMRLPYTTLDNKRRFTQLAEWIARTADHIVTVSETSKRDIVNLLSVPPEKVTNCYQSVEIPARYLDKPQDVVANELRGMFGLDYKGYFLFFGAIEPKKNVGRLIEGYLASGLEEPLVIVGEEAWRAAKDLSPLDGEHGDHLTSLVQSGEVTQTKRQVRRFKYSSLPALVSLIRGAKAVTVPSLYEGFGLPAVEAMVCGTPVITTKEGATPEIVEDGALLVNPYEPGDIRDALLAIAGNPNLEADLGHRGARRAEFFSPERYQRRLQELYARI